MAKARIISHWRNIVETYIQRWVNSGYSDDDDDDKESNWTTPKIDWIYKYVVIFRHDDQINLAIPGL